MRHLIIMKRKSSSKLLLWLACLHSTDNMGFVCVLHRFLSVLHGGPIYPWQSRHVDGWKIKEKANRSFLVRNWATACCQEIFVKPLYLQLPETSSGDAINPFTLHYQMKQKSLAYDSHNVHKSFRELAIWKRPLSSG